MDYFRVGLANKADVMNVGVRLRTVNSVRFTIHGINDRKGFVCCGLETTGRSTTVVYDTI